MSTRELGMLVVVGLLAVSAGWTVKAGRDVEHIRRTVDCIAELGAGYFDEVPGAGEAALACLRRNR